MSFCRGCGNPMGDAEGDYCCECRGSDTQAPIPGAEAFMLALREYTQDEMPDELVTMIATYTAQVKRECAQEALKYIESVHRVDIEYGRDKWDIDAYDLRAAILQEPHP